MTGSIPTDITVDEGVHQIPATTRAPETADASDARESLLRAISKEALTLADNHSGQASAALRDLAHAYALVTTAVPPTAGLTRPTGRASSTDLSVTGMISPDAV
ncbi:hypothetical protein ACIOD1_33120 [Streptomyces sp. NPDC088097]|uniref:hypothetical protein n=1 Tax=Streptomyces sp. NPDC088097 TaxID=3365823 RepID=UPI0038187379